MNRTVPLWLCLAVAVLPAAAWGEGCKEVDIIQSQPLSFGRLQLRPGVTGWVWVDSAGGFTTTPGVAFVASNLPVPGTVRIQAKPGTVIWLAAEPVPSGVFSVLDTVSEVSLSVRSQRLQKFGSFWAVKIPESESDKGEVTLNIGALMKIGEVEKPRELQREIKVRCEITS